MSLLTVRTFIAKFWDSGFFAVFEPRPMYDFTSRRFDMILSPIVGKALGGGYTLTFLAEIPVREESLHNVGALFLVGVKRTFRRNGTDMKTKGFLLCGGPFSRRNQRRSLRSGTAFRGR